MTEEQRKRIHDIVYSCDDRAELAERIVTLEDENAKLKNDNNYLHEMLSDSRQANEHLYAELKRHKSILRTRPNAMTALYSENAKLRELVRDMWTCIGEGEWDCSAYPRHDRCDEGVSEFVRRMRELRVEVDG